MKIKTWQYIIIGLLALGAVGLFAILSWLRPYDLGEERAAARAAGLPLTNAELVRPRPPAAQDAGPEWLALVEYLKKHPLDTKPVEAVVGKNRVMPATAVPEVRRLLRDHADVVARMHHAAAKPEAYFEHDFTAHDLFPYYMHMRTAAKLLRWEAMLLAREGKYAEAVRTQELGLNIADQLADEPILIAMLVSIAINAISTAGMEDILYAAGPDESVSRLVTAAIRRHPPKTSIAHALKGETLMGVNTIRSLSDLSQITALSGGSTPSGTSPFTPRPRNGGPIVRSLFLNPNEATYLHWMTRQYNATKLPLPERTAALEQAQSDLEEMGKNKSPSSLMSMILVPVFAKADLRNTSQEARHGVTLAAAAVLAYRDRTGQWPKTLAQAMPKPPTDPYNLPQAIGYRREGKGFVVYSAGDKRTFTASPGQPEKGQYLFRNPAPPAPFTPIPGRPISGELPGAPPMPGGPPMP